MSVDSVYNPIQALFSRCLLQSASTYQNNIAVEIYVKHPTVAVNYNCITAFYKIT